MSIRSSGFSLVEALIVVAVLLLVTGLALGSFQRLGAREALDKESANLISFLVQARALTLASRDAYEYGVHLDTTQITLFRGATYDAATSTNQHLALNPLVVIAGRELQGGGADVIFERLTGDTKQPGRIILSLASDPTITRVITIGATGVVE